MRRNRKGGRRRIPGDEGEGEEDLVIVVGRGEGAEDGDEDSKVNAYYGWVLVGLCKSTYMFDAC